MDTNDFVGLLQLEPWGIPEDNIADSDIEYKLNGSGLDSCWLNYASQ